MISETVAHRIVVFSGKGGVGKTTVAVNLACKLREKAYNVGLLDADITGPNVLKMMGITQASQAEGDRLIPHDLRGIKVVSLASLVPADAAVIWRGPMRSKALEQLLDDTQWGSMDTLIMDLPPGTGDEALTIAQQVKPQIAVVVTTPQEVALLDARRAITFARKLAIPTIAMVENMSGMVCPHCGGQVDLFGVGGGKAEALKQGLPFLGAIPIDPAARDAGDLGHPFVWSHPESSVAEAFDHITKALECLLQSSVS